MSDLKQWLVISSLALGLSGTAAVADEKAGPHTAHAAGQAQNAAQASGVNGSEELHKHMMKSASEMESMAMTGDADHDFVTSMKKHHQHGIEMAQIQLKAGKNPQAKAFANKIIAAQKREIAQFDAWLAKYKPAPAK